MWQRPERDNNSSVTTACPWQQLDGGSNLTVGREGFEPSKALQADPVCPRWPLGYRPVSGQIVPSRGLGPQGGAEAALTMVPPCRLRCHLRSRYAGSPQRRRPGEPGNRPPASTSRYRGRASSSRQGFEPLLLRPRTAGGRSSRCSRKRWSAPGLAESPLDVRQGGGGLQGLCSPTAGIQAGISSDHAKKINHIIKDLGLKGVSVPDPG